MRIVATLGRSRDWEEGNRGVWGPGDTLGVGYMRVLICKLAITICMLFYMYILYPVRIFIFIHTGHLNAHVQDLDIPHKCAY